jgi:hypothetical protein
MSADVPERESTSAPPRRREDCLVRQGKKPGRPSAKEDMSIRDSHQPRISVVAASEASRGVVPPRRLALV